MKLTTALILGVFTLGTTQVLADHRHADKAWDFRGAYKHAKHHHKVNKHHRIVHQQVHAISAAYGHHHNDRNYGEVIHVEPVYHSFTRPVHEDSCLRHDSYRPQYTSHTGTILGAVIGGALGHRIGDAHGDPKVAALAGGLIGASIGSGLDRQANYNRGLSVIGPCRVSHHQETVRELVEYKVTYRYNGRVHTARMDRHPGEWVKLDVDVSPA